MGAVNRAFRPSQFPVLPARLTVMTYLDHGSGLEVISLSECVHLLESNEVGRLAMSSDDGPRIYPINYHWDGEAIAFCTTPQETIAAITVQRQ